MSVRTSHDPLVSVVVPVFAPHPVFFRLAIESLLQQTFDDIEVVIVEDPSPSAGAGLLTGIDDTRIRHLVNRTRTSLPQQHNRGLSEARGRFICRFDADDICEPDRIEREIEFLRAHPAVDVVGSFLTIIDADGRTLGTRRYPTSHADILAAMRRYNPVANSSVMFRREVYERFGGWRDSSLPAQDYEWYSRLAAGGARFANLPLSLVRYRLHQGSIKSSKVHDTIRTTLDVKQIYWHREMDPISRGVMALERLLLLLPAWFVLAAFRLVRYRTLGGVRPGKADGTSVRSLADETPDAR